MPLKIRKAEGSGRLLALFTGLNLKTVAGYDLRLPVNRRFIVNRITLVGDTVDTLSNGATINIAERNTELFTAATLTTALTGANNDMVFTAKNGGIANSIYGGTNGNAITVRYVDPGVETATEVVAVVGTAITVTLRNVSTVLSTAAQVKTAIEASAAASALVTVANASANTGAGAVIALAATPLAGGLNYVAEQSIVDSVDLADTDAANKKQTLTDATTKAIKGGSDISVQVTGGATATTAVHSIVVDLSEIQ